MRNQVVSAGVTFGVMLAGALITATLAGACGVFSGEPGGDQSSSQTVQGGAVGCALDAGVGADGGGPDGGDAATTGAGTGAMTGLPCDVQQLFENRCIACHTGKPFASLLTYEDVLKPSSDPTQSVAQAALARIKSATSPMPPLPAAAATASEIATLEKWVTSGSPKGAVCTPSVPDANPDVGGGFNTPLVCTSGATWPGGNQGSPRMRPGGACITCHSMQGGPGFAVAGTVYPTAHEPNDCNGVNGAVTVEVTDAKGVVTSIAVNDVGNFRLLDAVAAPFHVKVKRGTKERAMAGALTAGDCNTCHTQAGMNGAPGRVVAP